MARRKWKERNRRKERAGEAETRQGKEMRGRSTENNKREEGYLREKKS